MQQHLPENINLYGWNGYRLAKGNLELGLAPQIGGRIISLKYQGEELLFVDKAHVGEIFDFSSVSDFKSVKTRLGFRLWGGDKTWVAPESTWIANIPPLELDAGQYHTTLEPYAITMESKVDQETGLRIIRRVELKADDQLILNQIFVNESSKPVKCSIWNVTQLLRPFEIYLPAELRHIQSDPRFLASVKNRHQLIKQLGDWSSISCVHPLQYKYGARVYNGMSFALRQVNHSMLVFGRFFDIDEDALYPHNNEVVEVYNSSDYPYFEWEILGPLVQIAPGDQTTLKQKWVFRKFNQSLEIDDIISMLNAIK